MNDFHVSIMLDKEEWRGYSVEDRKNYLQRLSVIDSQLAATLYECLVTFENEMKEENKISIEKTMQYYYGDDE